MSTTPTVDTSADADLIDASADHLRRTLPDADLLHRAEVDVDPTPEAWQAVLSVGLTDLALPAERDGLGATTATLAGVGIVAGRRLLPHAAREQAILLAPLLAHPDPGAPGPARAWLDDLRSGAAVGGGGALVGAAGPQRDAAGVHVDGHLVWLGPGANLVAVAGPERSVALALTHPAVRVEPVAGVDAGQGLHRLHVAGLDSAEAVVLEGAAAAALWRTWRLVVTAEAQGVGEEMVERAVAYATERRQFGRPIGTFQAVAHLLAEAHVGVVGGQSGLARAVALLAGGAVETADDLLASLGHWIPTRARLACEHAIQVHGGNGFSWEFGLHLHYRRALTLQSLLGGPTGSARRVGQALLREGPA